jgi:hypothetical protein
VFIRGHLQLLLLMTVSTQVSFQAYQLPTVNSWLSSYKEDRDRSFGDANSEAYIFQKHFESHVELKAPTIIFKS